MEDCGFRTVSIIGVGLLGGSIAKGLKKRNLSERIIGVGRNAEKLAKAQKAGLIDEFTTDEIAGVKESDVVIICTPVSFIPAFLEKIAGVIKPECLITDVGSTKASIVEKAGIIMGERDNFIGSHPMAGSEKSGADYADPDLYVDATCILTPDNKTSEKVIKNAETFWKALGAKVVLLDPKKHDQLIAAVSHIPNLTSVSLARLVMELGEDTELIKNIVGNGFRDTTRTSQGSPEMWKDIYLDNKEQILLLVDGMINILADFKNKIENDDANTILSKLSEIRKFRSKI